MKALIFNSGYGKRMGDFTKTHHKSQVVLENGETIFERQLRLLNECGIKSIIVTTGPFKEQLENASKKEQFGDMSFTFVENPIYDKTNYIYSMYLAGEYIDDDMLFLHGDLVFDKKLLFDVINSNESNLGMVNMTKELPEKDFKARIADGIIREVSINIFDDNCYAFQPLYKLEKNTAKLWLNRVEEFVENKDVSVYAENALNEISAELKIKPFVYDDYYIDEIDNADDLARVKADIRQYDFDEQVIYSNEKSIEMLPEILKSLNSKKPMIVSDCFEFLDCKSYIDSLDFEFVHFSGFSPNPSYEQVVEGLKLFKSENCDSLISIGGGSAIDTAKNIKLFSQLDNSDVPYVKQNYIYSPIKHIAIPATAGTGSESTRYSVVYYNGEKCSVTHDCIVPEYVILDYTLLSTLPLFQKKCTMLDALSQCIEAIWSVNTNEKCRDYAVKGIKLILENIDDYLNGEKKASHLMQIASNYSGKAINISQTTAGHAMSYKLTSLYGIPHGYAVALCLSEIWRYMKENSDDNKQLKESFEIINKAFNAKSTDEAIDEYVYIVKEKLCLESPKLQKSEDIEILTKSVNPVRLANNPIVPDEETIKKIYLSIFN